MNKKIEVEGLSYVKKQNPLARITSGANGNNLTKK